MEMRDRWQNWDQLSVGEDFWEMLEDLDCRRLTEFKAQLQAEHIQAQQVRRLSKKKIDRAKFMEEEPYSFMCKVPEAAS
jgi:HD superfamily phosphodiesterase